MITFSDLKLVVAALSKDGKDLGFHVENENAVLLGQVGLALNEYFNGYLPGVG